MERGYMLFIYNLISISVLFMMLYILYTLDYTLLLGEMVCTFIQYCSKEITHGWYPPIFKRPDGATDCSLFNTGGIVDDKSGFPSGHVASITLFMEIMLLRNKNRDWYTTMIYYVPILLVAYARYMKGCHNLIQITVGYLLGYSVANILYKYEANIKNYIQSIFYK